MLESRTEKAAGAQRRMCLLSRWHRDARGTTAVEFAMVAMPFMMMLFGIIGIALYFFTVFSVESAVEQAARLLRTGQAQQAGYTADQFKNKVCEFVPDFVDCQAKVKVNVLSFADTTSITPAALPKCLSATNNLSNSTVYAPGTASQVVLVWVCYEWELASKIPFLRLGDMANGSSLIQATSVFRTEPYDTN
jgi:Flp pilus assembly protein TadG